MKFNVFRRITLFGPRWYWRLKAANGRIIAQSEGYKRKDDCCDTVASIRKNAAYAKVEAGE